MIRGPHANPGAQGGFLNWNTSVKYVFFKWWNANTPRSKSSGWVSLVVTPRRFCPVGFAVANILLFLFAFLFEGLLHYRTRLDQHIAHAQHFPADPKRVRYAIICRNMSGRPDFFT